MSIRSRQLSYRTRPPRPPRSTTWRQPSRPRRISYSCRSTRTRSRRMPIRTSTVTVATRALPPISAPAESPSQVFKRAVPFCALLHAPGPPQPYRYSPDSRVSPTDLVACARQLRLDGIAITDHNSVAGIREAEAAAGDLIILPGIEISTRSGHVIAYGVREPIPRDLSVGETVERITALGGVAVAAHPYRFWSGVGEAALSKARFAAYETCNARTLRRGNE